MFEPEFVFHRNTLSIIGNVRINGNHTACKFIKEETASLISRGTELYQAQEIIGDKVKETYGTEWYDKNAEAINFIIETAYADNLRSRQPYVDKKGLNEYAHSANL